MAQQDNQLSVVKVEDGEVKRTQDNLLHDPEGTNEASLSDLDEVVSPSE